MADPEILESFRSSRKKWVFLLLSSIPFTAIGLWLASDPPDFTQLLLGFGSVLLFGSTAFVSILFLVHPGISSLIIGRQGISVRTPWRTRFYRWEEISRFGIETISTRYRGIGASKKFVGFDYSPGIGKNDKGIFKRLDDLFGENHIDREFDETLPDSYGIDPEELAEKLTKWREQNIN